MKVYGAISSSSSSSHADEDAPLLHNTKADETKPLPFVKFKGAKTIALAVAGVAACGAVSIVANTTPPGSNGNGALSAFRLGDALDDAKAGKTFVPTRSLSLKCEKDSIRFDRASDVVVASSSLLSFTLVAP